MFGIHDLWLFVVAGWLLNVTPGPDTAYIIGRSVQFGWRGGVAAACGISVGCLLHVFAAAIGLSALLAASSAGFLVVKLIGAAYLIWTGVAMLLARAARHPARQDNAPPMLSLRQVFWQGAMTNALNPKVALFFLAFLPQFVDADAAGKPLAFIVLGLIFIANGTLWNLAVALFTARVAGEVRGSPAGMIWINRALGFLFVALGIRVALLDAR